MKTTTLALAALALSAAWAQAARFSTAEISRAINDVRVFLSSGGSRPASIGSTVDRSNSVLTGKKSRAELTFPDDSIIRLGQNTSFSFLGGRREINVGEGTILLQQPKLRGRTEIRTAAVSAAITGTTVIVESSPLPDGKAAAKKRGEVVAAAEPHRGLFGWRKGKVDPPADLGNGIVKLLVLEGSMRFNLVAAPNKSMTLNPGEMVSMPFGAIELPRKFVFDINQLRKTSGLLGPDFALLPHAQRIDDEAIAQEKEKRDANLLEVDLAQIAKQPRFPANFIPPPQHANDVRNNAPKPPPAPVRIIRRPTPPPPPPPAPVYTPPTSGNGDGTGYPGYPGYPSTGGGTTTEP